MTRDFYDAEDATYREFWDPDGSLHWGVFEDDATGFIDGCHRWTQEMLRAAGIGPQSRVLDLGCGNGTVAAWLAQQTGASVTGIDLSAVRVGHAQEWAAANPGLRLEFITCSAAALPFADATFTHVFSQAVLYHVHAREQALAEVARVLEPEGLFVFDDLVTPQRPVSAVAREVVYDRLLFEPTFSAEDYTAALTRHGFIVYETRDLSAHLARSYELLADLAEPSCPRLGEVYREIPEVVRSAEVGWSFFLAKKVVDKLAWIYHRDPRFSLEQKYDAWSLTYDTDLRSGYQENPRRTALLLSTCLPADSGPVLDAGAGTGLVGEELRKLGYHDLTALDRSDGMLSRARAKGVYRRLVQGTLANAPELFAKHCFAAIVAVGVFTFAHAGSGDLAALDRVLAPGGWLVIAVRADYLQEQPALGATLAELGYDVVARDEYEIFDGEPMIALSCRKAEGDRGVSA
ncbi:methyltransferase domain-containing protein [Mycobacterium simiae]|uniref:Methyltransferase domain-containing protein n=2 Tax=Mycobacterium simiae TaxID=1784 RepID=A0A5B1BMY5_MYCSI|nr:methyltransferase domain-containing protein [Mycobacterium simiae]